MVSTNTLLGVAAVGGFVTAGVGYAFLIRMSKRVRESDYYQEALEVLRKHRGAVTVLGEPIKDYTFKLSNNDNFCDGSKAYFDVPVRGPKAAGNYFFWSEKDDAASSWSVTRAELSLIKNPSRRLVIVKSVTPDVNDNDVVQKQ